MAIRTRSGEHRGERLLVGVALEAVAAVGTDAATAAPAVVVDPATITPGLVLRFEANGLALVGPQPGFTRKVRWSAVSGLRFGPSGVLPGGVLAVSLAAVVNGWAVRCWIPWAEVRPDEVRALDRLLAAFAPRPARRRYRLRTRTSRRSQRASRAAEPVVGAVQSPPSGAGVAQPAMPGRPGKPSYRRARLRYKGL
jgi:hypothetical protein